MNPHAILLATIEAYRAQCRTHWSVPAARDAWQTMRVGHRATMSRYLNTLGVPVNRSRPAPADRFEHFVRECAHGEPIRLKPCTLCGGVAR